MQQNDRARLESVRDARDNFFRLGDDGVKAANRPADDLQTEAARGAKRGGIRQANGRTEKFRRDTGGFFNDGLRLCQFRLQARGGIKIREVAVRVGMIFQRVTFTNNLRGEFRIRRDFSADAKKCGGNFFRAQQFKQSRRRTRIGAVVKGQGDSLFLARAATNKIPEQFELRNRHAQSHHDGKQKNNYSQKNEITKHERGCASNNRNERQPMKTGHGCTTHKALAPRWDSV